MSVVYRARRVHIGDDVAVKILTGKFVKDDAALARFRREARAARRISGEPRFAGKDDHRPDNFRGLITTGSSSPTDLDNLLLGAEPAKRATAA
jgi:serine/threonine protein kinase